MVVMLRVEIDVFAIALCAIILTGIAARRNQRPRRDSHLIWMTFNTLLLLLATLLMGVTESAHGRWQMAVHPVTVFGYYFLVCFPAYWWVRYVVDSLGGGKTQMRLFTPLSVPLVAEILLVLLNPFTGCLYHIDVSNVYHNGRLLPLFFALNVSYVIYAMLLTGLNRRRVDSGTGVFLLLFPVLPAVCGFIQMRWDDCDLMWPSVALLLAVLYFRALNQEISVDYLTGLYNRMQADKYMALQIRRGTPRKPFSGVMIDVDNFKEINDRFGHQTGDEALLATARLLRKNIGRRNFLARYGGDEFIAILHTGSRRELEETARRIEAAFVRFNDRSPDRYRLSVSMGYDVYSGEVRMTQQQFARHIDRLMYMEKRNKREIRAESHS